MRAVQAARDVQKEALVQTRELDGKVEDIWTPELDQMISKVKAKGDLATARALLRCFSAAEKKAEDLVHSLTQAAPPTSRTGYLKALSEIIGEAPEGRSFQEELPSMVAEWCKENCQEDVEHQIQTWSRPAYTVMAKNAVANLCKHGWAEDDAIDACLLNARRYTWPMAQALREGDNRFAASTYRLCGLLAARIHAAEKEGLPPSTKMYAHLRGDGSLVVDEPAWERILEADATGFRGLVSKAATRVVGAVLFKSMAGQICLTHNAGGDYQRCAGDIVCFESAASDEQGALHAAIVRSQPNIDGCFPPNTLFTLKEVKEPGDWKVELADGTTKEAPKERLLVVTATFMDPLGGRASSTSGKMAGTSMTLQYGSREAYVKGLQDIINKPLITMSQEFDRDFAWTDWKSKEYTLKGEWAYVTGKAVRLEGCTPGTRDDNNDGKTPEDFLNQVNTFIKQRRDASHGLGLPADYAMLTMEEMLAVRLYSGPAYQPLNGFLRQIGNSTGHFRAAIAHDPYLTFAATIGHLCHAIRKLSVVATPEEVKAPLYRGIRGTLPRGFWAPDAQGMVCATDTAFMSTSRNRHTPVHYMGSGENVLWELETGAPTDAGYHWGADIKMLSQFALEDEVLFPPCTFLLAKKRAGKSPKVGAGDVAALAAQGNIDAMQRKEGEKEYVAIKVKPHFV